MKLIALCGAAGAGKDTVADMLPARKLAFADTLYAEVAEAWRLPESELRCRGTKELPTKALALLECQNDEFVVDMHMTDGWTEPRSPRQILQWWGDYRRAQDPDYFVRIAEQHALNGFGPCVITDVRFPNEAAMVRQLGGQIWQIRRPGYEAGGTGHASDTDGSEFEPDRVIYNLGLAEDMRHVVLAAWEGA